MAPEDPDPPIVPIVFAPPPPDPPPPEPIPFPDSPLVNPPGDCATGRFSPPPRPYRSPLAPPPPPPIFVMCTLGNVE